MRRASRRKSRASRRTRRSLALVFALIFAPAAARSARAACVELALPATIDDTGGNSRSVQATDLDGDGDLDLLSSATGRVAWHENLGADGSTWTTHAIAADLVSPQDVDAADLDGDGDLDVVVADFAGGGLLWEENTAGDGSGWSRHTLLGTADTYVLSVADLDGDGDLDVVYADFVAGAFLWMENAAGDGSSWTLHTIATAGEANQVFAADLDGDGDRDVLSAAYTANEIAWQENLNGDGSSWTTHAIATGPGLYSLLAADLDGDGDLDALASAFVGTPVTWFENLAGDGSSWTVHSIDSTSYGRAVVTDVDGDGDLDAVVADALDDTVAWFENDGQGGGWTRHLAPGTLDGVRHVAAADLDRDGDADLASAEAGADDRISWIRNERLHGEGLFAPTATVSSAHDQTAFVIAADFDGDGDPDPALSSAGDSVIAWFESGPEGLWTEHVVGTSTVLPFGMAAADLDRDGDLDLLSAAFTSDRVDWYENENDGTTWSLRTIGTEILGATAVAAVDLDRDGDLDAASASWDDHTVAWFENDGDADPALWTRHVVASSTLNAVDVAAADLDRDGDPDLVSAHFGGQAFLWHESDGTPGDDAGWATHTIDEGSHIMHSTSVAAADFDRDGDLDVLGTAAFTNFVAWYENDGLPDPATWTRHDVTTLLGGASQAVGVDFDRDGDLDVLAGGQGANQVVWYENDGSGGGWALHVLSTTATTFRSVFAADLDRDGDPDALSASLGNDELAWYPNLGTHVHDDGFDSDANTACWSSSVPPP